MTVSRASSDPVTVATRGVVELARFAASHGWVPATSGNFSVRIDATRAAMSATGADKSRLAARDVIVSSLDGLPAVRASAEAPLHLARYRAVPGIGAIAHVHSLAATLVSRRHASQGTLTLQGWEILKAFNGVRSHEDTLTVPILANDQDTTRLAALAEARLAQSAPTFGYLIAGHGLYVWGATPDETRRHLEAFDFLLDLHLHEATSR